MKTRDRAIAIIAALLFSAVFAILVKWIQAGDPFRTDTIFFGTIVFLNILILGSIARRQYRKYSTRTSVELKPGMPFLFLWFTFLALAISLALVSMGTFLYYQVKGLDMSGFLDQLIRVELPAAIRQFAVWILIVSALLFYVIWRKAVGREQKLREENLAYRYRNLKTQVNPHFLFNSLNTLSEIIYEDTGKADAYIQKLSAVYRYILENEETDLVPLDHELDFVRQFFSLREERDPGKILLEIDIEETGKFRVVPVSVQILVENALKHNSMSERSPLKIRITGNHAYITVSNNIQRKNMLEGSLRTGLPNLGERVKLVLDRELIVQEEHGRFTVKLPVKRISG